MFESKVSENEKKEILEEFKKSRNSNFKSIAKSDTIWYIKFKLYKRFELLRFTNSRERNILTWRN